MEYTYKEIIVENLGSTFSVIKRSDGACIPTEMGNSDYREYLEWLESNA